MSINRIILHDYPYFLTTRTQSGLDVFKNKECCRLLIKDIAYYRKELEFLIYAYVIMPNHFHWIIHPSDKANISFIMNKVKGHSSFVINKYLDRKGKLWQARFHDHVIRNGPDLREKINYIHKNPVTADLVEVPEDYKYSSCRNYYLHDDSILVIDVPDLSPRGYKDLI